MNTPEYRQLGPYKVRITRVRNGIRYNKPTHYRLWGKTTEVDSHIGLLRSVCADFIERFGSQFKLVETAQSLERPRGRRYISRVPDDVGGGSQIGGTGYYVIKFGAPGTWWVFEGLLSLFKVPASEFEVFYEK